jgi:hypothetical protein
MLMATGMTAFYIYFPDLAVRETRTLTVRGQNDLPDGEYGFLELYCDDPQCDCRRVIFHVVAQGYPGKVFATINYGWESQDFYVRWMRGDREAAAGMSGAHLEPFGPQSEYSSVLLHYCEGLLLADEAYVARLKRHYGMVKEAVSAGRAAKGKTKSRPRRRR